MRAISAVGIPTISRSLCAIMNRFKVSLETRRGGGGWLKGIFKFGDKRLDVLSATEIFVKLR